MLLAAWATTRPSTASARYPHWTDTSQVSRSAPMARSPPIRPDVTVIEKTAARVITSHLLIASGGRVMPAGRFAVFMIVRQVANRDDIWPFSTLERATPRSLKRRPDASRPPATAVAPRQIRRAVPR